LRGASTLHLLLALVPAASLALAACERNRDRGCPGQVFAVLALHGALDAAATGCAVPPQAGWNVPATLPDGTQDGTFDAVLAWDQGAQQLAYCSGGSHAAPLLGTRSGDHLRAQVTIPGAVLGQCAVTCTPFMTVTVEGDLSASTSPMTFTGTLTETFEDGAGDCGVCQLPCTSTYALTGTGR
jgi:hypothetical protein